MTLGLDISRELPLATSRQFAAPVEPHLHLLPEISEPETIWRRWMYLAIAVLIVAGYGLFVKSYWVPAPSRPGIDESAYLVGGRNIFEHGTPGFKPSNDYQFVGAMWVRTDSGWYYPKYPAGLPLLNAIAMKLGGSAEAAFIVSPACMVLSVLGMFLLTRAIAGSFCGILAMILIGMNYVSLEMGSIPNSHPPALFMVVWGMFFLVRWWQTGSWWRGILAGLLIGYAVTIRYSEALLLFPLYPLDQILHDTNLPKDYPLLWQLVRVIRFLPVGPLGLAVLLSIRWKDIRSYLAASLPILGWLVPVGSLIAFNLASMGHMTGYDTTNESTGFTSTEFLRKWDFTIHELYTYGLFLLLPLGIAGMIVMNERNWRVGALLLLWFVPGTLLYNAYYWGRELPGLGFLRFFLTLFPPAIIGALWLIRSAGTRVESQRSIAWPIAAGSFTAITASMALIAALPDMERQQRGNINLHISANRIITAARTQPKTFGTPVVFADEGLFPMLLQYTQFMAAGDWYPADAFEPRMKGGFGLMGLIQGGKESPVPLQKARVDYMSKLMDGKPREQHLAELHRIIGDAIAQQRPILAALTRTQVDGFRTQIAGGGFELVEIDHWSEPCAIRPPFSLALQSDLLMPPTFSGEPLIRWQPQALILYRIARSSPTTNTTITRN